MFIRFVAAHPAENAYLCTGIITFASQLRDEDVLALHEVEIVDNIFAWFNDTVPCPPFNAMLEERRWSRNAVSWLRDNADDVEAKLWELSALLRENGIEVRMIQTADPGRIVYRDQYQVVAETPRDAIRKRIRL